MFALPLPAALPRVLVLLPLAACIQVPALEQKITEDARSAEAVDLKPIEVAIAGAPDPRLDTESAEELRDRAEALARSADALAARTPTSDLDARRTGLESRGEVLRTRE